MQFHNVNSRNIVESDYTVVLVIFSAKFAPSYQYSDPVSGFA